MSEPNDSTTFDEGNAKHTGINVEVKIKILMSAGPKTEQREPNYSKTFDEGNAKHTGINVVMKPKFLMSAFPKTEQREPNDSTTFDEEVKPKILMSAGRKTEERGNEIGGVNLMRTFQTGVFRLAIFLRRIAINSLGNEGSIRAHFAYLYGYTDQFDIPDLFHSDKWSFGFLYPFGGLFGSVIGLLLVDKVGRKLTTIFFCCFMIVGAIQKIISRYTHIALLFISRFFDGIVTSGFMVSTVLLILECINGKVDMVYKPLVQMCINLGILFMGIIGLNLVSATAWNLIHITAITFTVVLAICNFN